MGILSSIKAAFVSMWSGVRHFFRPRLTLKYPDQKLDLQGPGYQFDAKAGVGRPGFKGRHLLLEDKCTGCQLCAIACDGIAVAIEMQELDLKRPHNKKDIWPAVDYGRCVPPATPIITIDGVKPMSEISVGDRVLTHTGKFQRVTQLFTRSYTGKLYTFRTLGNFESLTTTEDHPILTYGEGGVSWEFANKIEKRTYLTQPILVGETASELVEFNYELHPQGGGSFTTEVVSLRVTPQLMRLIGYYLAEGTSDRYRVSFDINKKEDALREDIVACTVSVFGAEVSLKPDPDSQGLKLCIDSVRVASFFSQFGHHCDSKQLPWSMVMLPLESIKEIVKGVYLGDGHHLNKYYSYKTKMHSNYFTTRTTSNALALQLRLMLGRLGIVSSISTQRQKGRKQRYSVTVHSPYVERMAEILCVSAKNNEVSHGHVRLREGMLVSPVVQITTEDVQDYVVQNIEVEEDNSYIAAGIAVHNCVFCGLCVDACPFDALVMTNEYELASYDRASLKYTPEMLFVPPGPTGKYKVKIDPERGIAKHG